MSVDLIHSVKIPHEKVRPIGDNVQVRVPSPPEKSGTLIIPEQAREVLQHNVIAAEVTQVGPMAFWYRDVDGKPVQFPVQVGDWCIFRPFAGTFVQPDGKVGAMGGWRYLSAHRDIIGVIPAADIRAANPVHEGGDPTATRGIKAA